MSPLDSIIRQVEHETPSDDRALHAEGGAMPRTMPNTQRVFH